MLAVVLAPLLALASPVVDHDLDVTLAVIDHRIDVVDHLSLDAERTVVELLLHAGMNPAVDGAQVEVAAMPLNGGVPAVRVRAQFAKPTRTITLRYGGVIEHPPAQVAGEHQRSVKDTPGTITPEGVYLSAASLWVPRLLAPRLGSAEPVLHHELVTMKMSVHGMPDGWRALSQGAPARASTGVQSAWIASAPSHDVHLVAGPFIEMKERKQGVDVLIWLRAPGGVMPADGAALAQRYLDVTGTYLARYAELIGPYPYGKLALVENFWETGWGMPSFALLGSQVIRLPFILHTSWPHELLHNWWGNGVFVKGGNWSEGLTAYLADHLHAEQQGQGAGYRQTTLQKYQDLVATQEALDFPLSAFTARTSAASEAVGYGKWLMVVHMLRTKLGDEAFKRALQTLWKEHRFARAGFDDVRAAMQTHTKEDLGPFFAAWVERAGAPRIRWQDVREHEAVDGSRRVEVVLQQTQALEMFPMDVPVVVTTVDGRTVTSKVTFAPGLPGGAKTARVSIPVPAATARVDVDPFADTFRTLLEGEVAPALSRALGAKKALFVLPTFASSTEREAWRAFASALCASCGIVDDKTLDALPTDAAVWVLGYGNQLRGGIAAAAGRYGARFDDHGLLPPGRYTKERLKTERTDPRKTSVVLALPHPLTPSLAMTFVGAHSDGAIPQLARKIPHYGRYGYLAFTGKSVESSLKGQWQSDTSPLTVFLSTARPPLTLASGPPLARLPEALDAGVSPLGVRVEGLRTVVADVGGHHDLLGAKRRGEKVSIVFVRDGKERPLTVTSVER